MRLAVFELTHTYKIHGLLQVSPADQHVGRGEREGSILQSKSAQC